MHSQRHLPGKSGFPGSARLKKKTEFSSVFKKNRRASGRYFRILVRYRRNQHQARLGIVVSKRVSKSAVERNRIKRQIRECFRLQQAELRSMDLVVIANPSCAGAASQQLRASLVELLQTLHP